MRFLVDAQLPPALAQWMRNQGHQAEHVFEQGLHSASDRDIWNHVKQTQAVIVSKDEDFVTLTETSVGAVPFVWLRIGNTTIDELLKWFSPLFPWILDTLDTGERLIEVTGQSPGRNGRNNCSA